MALKVAVNGFGIIGRLAFREMFDKDDFEIVAINDLSNAEMIAYLLKYHARQGKFRHWREVTSTDHALIIGDRAIPVFNEPDASKLPWKELGVDVILECTGAYTSRAKAQKHLDAGAKKVVISAPAGKDVPTVVYNINHKTLKPEDRIISTASCTTNCLAPMAKALNELAPIQGGIICTVHAYTSDQSVIDGPFRKNDFRRSRAAAENIVPTATGAAKAIGLVLPELDGKLIGAAQRIPLPVGSVTLLMASVKGRVSVDEINAAMKSAVTVSFGYNDEEIVSKDIIGMDYGSLFDSTQTLVVPMEDGNTQVQVAAWYDNEHSYVQQMIRTLKYLETMKGE